MQSDEKSGGEDENSLKNEAGSGEAVFRVPTLRPVKRNFESEKLGISNLVSDENKEDVELGPSSSRTMSSIPLNSQRNYLEPWKSKSGSRRNANSYHNDSRGSSGKRGGGGGRRPDTLHFLHGGNIRDPLNLKSVRPDDPNAPVKDRPMEVIVPKNPNDPLNLLNMPSLEEVARKRKKKRKHSIPLEEIIVSPVCQRRFSTSRFKKPKRAADEGKLPTSEVVLAEQEQECASSSNATRSMPVEAAPSKTTEENAEIIAKKAENQRLINNKYCYGNYNHYRKRQSAMGVGCDPVQFDTRVQIFCEDWFNDKRVLDIGCGAGAFVISLAQSFRPARVLGVDIDSHLIGAARKSLRHFTDKNAKIPPKFPASFALNFGPISGPTTSSSLKFPDNILFRTENYVPSNDEQLEKIEANVYDTVTAISVVKWVHLNWGDVGLKQFFRRVFRQMRNGGRFILEVEAIDAYRKMQKKNRLTVQMRENLDRMAFFPDDFCAFLLNEDEVGFKHHETLDTPLAHTLGWSGRLHVFYKGEFMIAPNLPPLINPSSTEQQIEHAPKQEILEDLPNSDK